MIDDIISGLLGGYLADRLLKFVRPKKTSRFDDLSFDELIRRNNWIEVVGTVTFAGTFLFTFIYLLSTGINQNPWRIALMFCFPVTLTLIVVSALTLPKGICRFREFWRFHELKRRTRLALLLTLYIPLAALGIIAPFKSFT